MRRLLPGALIALALAGCGPDEVPLPGERLPLRADAASEARIAPVPLEEARPIALPPERDLAEWTHRNATPERRVPHVALGPLAGLAWSAEIGAPDTRRQRITAAPVVAGGRVFTLDARAGVAAHDLAGRALWFADLRQPTDPRAEASGGGLAFGAGALFVTTAGGLLAALDPATGGVRWVQRLGAAATGAPAVRDGLVYAVSRDGTGWAVDAATGRVAWQVAGLPEIGGFVSPSGPAVSETLALFPFSTGELLATFREGGAEAWRASVGGTRVGRALADFEDVTGDPVFADGRVYVGNGTGRTVALEARTGERVWTADEGALSPVWPAGDSVFLVSDASDLVRLDAQTGRPVWRVALPGFVATRPARRRAVHAHYGPVLAGGRLWVASSDGLLRGFSPVNGALLRSLEIPGGAAAPPAVAGRTLYVVTTEGRLLAYR